MVSTLDLNSLTKPPKVQASYDCGDGCLFNIKQDPNEYNNLATTMPDMLKTMQKKLQEYQSIYLSPDRGNDSQKACETALNKYGGFWGPFLP